MVQDDLKRLSNIGGGGEVMPLTARGTASCQLSKLKCMTASVYPHTTQLRLFAVRPSNTVKPMFLCLDEPLVSEMAPRPRSRKDSLSTAVASRLMHSESSWKSSWASWCSREHSNGFVLPSGSIERALMSSIGLMALTLECGIFSAKKGKRPGRSQGQRLTMQQVSEGIYDGCLDIKCDRPCVNVFYLGLKV